MVVQPDGASTLEGERLAWGKEVLASVALNLAGKMKTPRQVQAYSGAYHQELDISNTVEGARRRPAEG